MSYRAQFDEAAAARWRTLPEFAAQDRTGTIGGTRYDVYSLATIRAEYAFSTGLTGVGETIAVVDSGFRPSHQEFDNKTVWTFGTLATGDHGTGVAAIAAAENDGTGMMGVAPGANLHLSSYNAGWVGMAGATSDALAKGAIVQNNSWGYTTPITDVLTWLAANPNGTVEQAISATVGGSAANVRTYLNAITDFVAKGVVVFAAPNEDEATSLSVMDGLPLAVPSLAEGWLVAVNAVPTYSAGKIVSADRLSSACLQMAHSCLVAEGVVYTASATSDTSYRLAVGTSFAAPQVAGGIALLAEAFPTLPASDLRRRLLASANNGFFSHTGSTDFGNGVVHGYGQEFGHGFLDLKAALAPIGAVGLAATDNAYGGVVPLGSTYLAAGSPQGDAIARALESETIVVFDSLGADFAAPGSVITAETRSSTLEDRFRRFKAGTGSEATPGVATFALSQGEAGEASGWHFHAGETTGVLYDLGLVATNTPILDAAGSMAALAPDAYSVAVRRDLGDGSNLSVFSFSNALAGVETNDNSQLASASGGGLAMTQAIGSSSLTLGASFMSETRSALGLTAVGAQERLDGLSASFDVGYSIPLPIAETRLMLSAQLGTGQADGEGLLLSTRDAVFSGFGLALESRSVWTETDRLSLFARQPLRMEAGTATLSVANGRTTDGTIQWGSLDVDLTPSARQFDIGFDYGTSLGPETDLRFGAALSYNDGHIAGATGMSAMGVLTHRF